MKITWCAAAQGEESSYHDTEAQAMSAARRLAAARPGTEAVWYPMNVDDGGNA